MSETETDAFGAWAIDQYGNEYGHCNSCGEEAARDSECCDDGEVVPSDETTEASDE